MSRKVRGNENDAGTSNKKERDPNWSKAEILNLIEAKRQEHVAEMAVEDPRELMCPELGKWGKIAMILNAGKGEGDVERDRDACKYKWSTLLSDFKKIWDFHSRTGRNSEEYFHDTTAEEKKLHKLPKSFYAVAYRNMAEWLKDKATMTPPHTRDTSDPNDANYQSPIPKDAYNHIDLMDTDSEDPWQHGTFNPTTRIDLTAPDSPAVSSAQSQGAPFGNSSRGVGCAPVHTTSTAELGRGMASFQPPRRLGEDINLNAPPPSGGTPPKSAPVALPSSPTTAPFGGHVGQSAPAGSIPPVSRQGRHQEEIHVLSSTSTSAAAELGRSMGSTGHRKKRSAEASAIADGVNNSAEKMVKVLRDINDTQKTTEIEVILG